MVSAHGSDPVGGASRLHPGRAASGLLLGMLLETTSRRSPTSVIPAVISRLEIMGISLKLGEGVAEGEGLI